MTSTALAIRKVEVSDTQQERLVHLVDSSIGEVASILREAIRNPIFSMVGSAALIEYLQTVWVTYTYEPNGAGGWNPVKRPLISQPLATLLEGVIISTQALESQGLNNLVNIIKGILK